MSTQKTTPLTERQLDLITRAHDHAGGLIEPLLSLKGGAKLKMIASLAQRGLIAQCDGQWRITPAAVAIVQGHDDEAGPGQATRPTTAPENTPPLADDPEIEAVVTAAETLWQTEKQDAAQRLIKVGVEGKPKHRSDSKQSQVIEMLKRPEGVTIAQIGEITGWLNHTTRGFFAGAVKKKLGMTITTHNPPQGDRVYRVETATA